MFCQKCGNKVKEDDKYCLKCGTPVGSKGSPTTPKTEAPSAPAKSTEFPWKLVAIALLVIVGIGAATAIVSIANSPPDEKVGSVAAPNFDPTLAGGGLSSDQLGSGLLLESLQSSEPIGYQILQDGIDESVIDNFKQVRPGPKWSSEFRMDDSDFTLQFKNNKEFLLGYPASQKSTADKLFAIASRYGFLSNDASSELQDLDERTTDLVSALNDRSLTEGSPESDLASEASTLVSDWDAWLAQYGADSSEAPYASARRDVVSAAGSLASNPTNSGIDGFNAAIENLQSVVNNDSGGE